MAMAAGTAMAMEIDGGIADSEGKSQSWKNVAGSVPANAANRIGAFLFYRRLKVPASVSTVFVKLS